MTLTVRGSYILSRPVRAVIQGPLACPASAGPTRGVRTPGDRAPDPQPGPHAVAAARLPQHPPPRRAGRGLRAPRPPAPLAPGRRARRRRGGAALALVPAPPADRSTVARAAGPAVHAHVVDWQASTWDDGPRVVGRHDVAARRPASSAPSGLPCSILPPAASDRPAPAGTLPPATFGATSAPGAPRLPAPALDLLSRSPPRSRSGAATARSRRASCLQADHRVPDGAGSERANNDPTNRRPIASRRRPSGSTIAPARRRRPMALAIVGQEAWTTGLAWRGRRWSALVLWPTCCTTCCSTDARSRRRRGRRPGESRSRRPKPPAAADDGHPARGEVEGRRDPDRAGAMVDALPAEVGVPGRIEANPTAGSRSGPAPGRGPRGPRRARAEGQAGRRRWSSLDSPDVGTARLNLRARQRELATARTEADWKHEVAANVATLIPELRKGDRPPAVIEKEFADQAARAPTARSLLQAYAEFDIAAHEEEKTDRACTARRSSASTRPSSPSTPARGPRPSSRRRSSRSGSTPPSRSRLADQQVRNAEAAVDRRGPAAPDPGRRRGHRRPARPRRARPRPRRRRRGRDRLPDRRPVRRHDHHRTAVPSQKAELNDVLFTLADLSTVWVMANVPESDFAVAARRSRAGPIRLTATAYPGRDLRGQAALGRRDGRPHDPDRPAPGRDRQPRRPAQARACSSGSCSTARPARSS